MCQLSANALAARPGKRALSPLLLAAVGFPAVSAALSGSLALRRPALPGNGVLSFNDENTAEAAA
ncbi:hypothetical protein D3C71_2083350 [compost metagenome]